MKKRLLAMLLTASMAVSMTACGGDSESTAEGSATAAGVTYKNEIQIAVNSEPPSMDPHMSVSISTRETGRYIWECLFELNSQYQATPQLCESVEHSDDNKTWTFYLRKGVKFHNGDEMTADDVVASLNRWARYSSAAKNMITADEQFTKVDDNTVQLVLTKPNLFVPETLANPTQFSAIMPQESVEAAGDGAVVDYIGTGPMTFVEWRENQSMKLQKFAEYCPPDMPIDGAAGDRTVSVESAVINFVTDAATRLAGAQSGQYDVAVKINYDNLAQLESMDSINIVQDIEGTFFLCFMKNEGSIFYNNPKLRQAIAMGIDIDEIMAAAVPAEGYCEIIPSYLTSEQSDWFTGDAGSDVYNTKDTAKAKALIAEAGYDGTPLRMVTTQSRPTMYNASLVLQQQLEALGFTVDLQVYDWAAFLEHNATEEYTDLYVTNYPPASMPAIEPYLMPTGAGHANDEHLTELFDQMKACKTQEEAKAIWADAQSYCLNEYVPIVKLADHMNVNAVQSTVENFDSFLSFCLWGDVKVREK